MPSHETPSRRPWLMLPVALALACGGTADIVEEVRLVQEPLTTLADPTACSANSGAGPFRVYMSTSGNDANTGRASSSPVLTLSRVQDIIRTAAPTCPTEVRIGTGTYYGQTVAWSYVSGHEIKFMPADGTNAVRPVFDGCSSASGACTQGTWFTLGNSSGVQSKLHFWYIRVQRYNTAISFNGQRDNLAGYNGGNRIYGCYFERIGNGWAGATSHAPSTAAVRLVNSDRNGSATRPSGLTALWRPSAARTRTSSATTRWMEPTPASPCPPGCTTRRTTRRTARGRSSSRACAPAATCRPPRPARCESWAAPSRVGISRPHGLKGLSARQSPGSARRPV